MLWEMRPRCRCMATCTYRCCTAQQCQYEGSHRKMKVTHTITHVTTTLSSHLTSVKPPYGFEQTATYVSGHHPLLTFKSLSMPCP